ncbi:MAG TPA: trypsin-like peptidase domain-containing protein [Bacillota bacterium]|nr:trypsin-like peptidase domain-containing protein [Bacillota bacterium]
MFAYDRDFYGRRGGFFSHLLMGIIGAVIGGLIVAIFAPTWGVVGKGTLAPNLAGSSTLAPAVTTSVYSGGTSAVIDIAQKVGPTVVGISNRGNRSLPKEHPTIEEGTGSGVIISDQGYIVTNNHVVEGATSIMVSLANGNEVEGTIIGTDPRTDLAVVKIDPKKAGSFTVARMGNSDQIQVGELAVAIGNPLGEDFARTVTSGIVSALNRTVTIGEQKFHLLQTDAAINPGNSGGALVNSRGEVIGINSIKIMGEKVEGISFAIPINSAKPIIEDLITKGKVTRPWIGIIYRGNLSDPNEKGPDTPIAYGVLVDSVVENAPAAKAGMKAKDVIISLDGEKIVDFAALQAAIEKHKIGQTIPVVVLRNKTEVKVTLTLGEMPKQVLP